MSNILQCSDAMNAPELQVWNNAAFDNEESDRRWSSCIDPDSAFDKENHSPVAPKGILKVKDQESEEEEKRIDSEIEAIETEIRRLSSRLEALRIEKAERKSKASESRGRIVAAKFLEPTPKKSFNRRGLSLGPSEILAGAGMRRLSKIDVTPIQSAQNRRKSCFWKLEEIDELRATKERGKSQSLSPKSRKTVSKTQPPKQAVTTSRKLAVLTKKKDEAVSTIQPKKLFAVEKSSKKPSARPGRVVASRYNSSSGVRVSSEARKRSFPEAAEEEEAKRGEKKRVSSKKRWEIPSEVVVFGGSSEKPCSAVVLPKIRTLRCGPGESPLRDSGPAKRVAELVGRRSFFCHDEGDEPVCQALSFAEDEMSK